MSDKVFLSAWASALCSIVPPDTTEISPVSSDTTTTIASDSSVRPMAARWRVPRDFEMFDASVNGRKQPAAISLPFRMMAAPSWIGEYAA